MAPHSSERHHELLNRRTRPPPPHTWCAVCSWCVWLDVCAAQYTRGGWEAGGEASNLRSPPLVVSSNRKSEVLINKGGLEREHSLFLPSKSLFLKTSTSYLKNKDFEVCINWL